MGKSRRLRRFPFLKPSGHLSLRVGNRVAPFSYTVLYPFEGGFRPRQYWSVIFFDRRTGKTYSVEDMEEIIEELKSRRDKLTEEESILLRGLEGETIYSLLRKWAEYFIKRKHRKLFYSLAYDILNDPSVKNQVQYPELEF